MGEVPAWEPCQRNPMAMVHEFRTHADRRRYCKWCNCEMLRVPDVEPSPIASLVPAADSPAARQRAVVESVVNMLRELLVRAETGEIEGIVIGIVKNDGDIGCRWSEHENTVGMLASITMAQHRFARHVDDIAVDETAEEPCRE